MRDSTKPRFAPACTVLMYRFNDGSPDQAHG
jgi:hypothetical protein